MRYRHVHLVVPCAACLLLSGCSLWSSPPLPPVEPTPVSPVVAFMRDNNPGAAGSLHDPEFGGEVRVHVEDEFLSATNAVCRRATLLSAGHEAEVVVICRDNVDTAPWRLMPRVWGKGI